MTKQFEDQSLASRFVGSMKDVPASQWDALVAKDYPFLRHAFLQSLEESACVARDTGWLPCHYLLFAGNRLIAAAPGYLKYHSYGEYVFDWAWADAYHQHGMEYYPKLLTAIPFTPCAGPRLLMLEEHQNDAGKREHIYLHYKKACIDYCSARGVSSWHVLFPEGFEDAAQEGALVRRSGTQFHWYNRDYEGFDDFLARMSANKRKSIRKERRKLSEAGIVVKCVAGDEVDAHQLACFHTCYQSTYLKRGQSAYLNQEFFQLIFERMPESLLLMLAYEGERIIAAALFFKGATHLYGRYWGCLEEFKALHFELCYYQGIEYCIEHGLLHFDAGAQGEHKIARGFEPIETCSYHWVAHEGFRHAIKAFVDQEKTQIQYYMKQASNCLPYKK